MHRNRENVHMHAHRAESELMSLMNSCCTGSWDEEKLVKLVTRARLGDLYMQLSVPSWVLDASLITNLLCLPGMSQYWLSEY